MSECWFDTRDGKLLVGEASYSQSVEQSLPGDVVPLADLLVQPEFSYKTGDFVERGRRIEWDTDQKLAAGRWVLGLLEQATGEPQVLTTGHFDRLRVLGLAPDPTALREFGGIQGFREQVGSPLDDRGRYGTYRKFTPDQWLDFARRVEARVGGMPTADDYAADGGPSKTMLLLYAGGVNKLNDQLGYPDIKSWKKEDYLDWAVKVIKVNGEQNFNLPVIRVLAARRRGPDGWTIRQNCKSWSAFKEEAIDTYQFWREEEEYEIGQKLDWYKHLMARGHLPAEYGDLERSELFRRAGRYRVVSDCLPNIDETLKRSIAAETSSLYRAVRRCAPGLTDGHIEMVAVSLKVFDDIWPMEEEDLEYLRVSDEEIARERAKAAAYKARSDANIRQRRFRQAS